MDDDHDGGQRPPSRPSTAHKLDSEPDFDSPAKPSMADALHPDNIPSLRPPNLPVPESSYLESPSINQRHSDSQAEIIVRQHLQDIESSFNAPISPLPTLNSGVDDTFVFDSPSKKPVPRSAPQPASVDDSADASQLLPTRSPQEPRQDARDSSLLSPTQQRAADDSGNVTASLEAFSSSPAAAAAAARSISRSISQAPSVRNSVQDQGAVADPGTPDDSLLHAESNDSDLNQDHTQESEELPPDAGHTPGHALKSSNRSKYLRSRTAPQRSSVSSLVTDSGSDATISGGGADYALQSGGSAPAAGMPRTFNKPLSRSISMGSMASGIDDHDSSGPVFNQLETLDEVDSSMSPQSQHHHQQPSRRNPLETPKPTKSLAPPTDTVIARHVRDVQVPESLAKEYKSRSGLVTPGRPGTSSDNIAFGASTASRHGRSLTLKEQSSTIERLSKENFDLKLKVMFLSDRLDKLSEEGIKEMISENVELKTGLAVLQRDNKVLRRRVKELEKQLKDEQQERPGTAKSGHSDDEPSAYDAEAAQEREEEIIYLREQLEEYMTEIERLRNENLAKEAEKRRMAEVVRTLGERTGERLGADLERQEEADVWKDLFEQETARREQSDEDNRRLRDEVFRLKQELAQAQQSGPLHHTTNIYNITRKGREHTLSPPRAGTSVSGDMDANGAMSVTSTLVEELRRESEQLRHENAELRREVGAQTSMLTSRNREKERLYQEIEDLKMAQRRGGPAPSTVDSVFERSASRAGVHERSASRASRVATSVVDEEELEEMENRMAELRDKNNTLKLQNQDLQRELDACMEDFEAAVAARKQADELVATLQEDLDAAMNDLMALQAERDEALQEHANLEAEFEALRKEAQDEIDALEGEADQRTAEIERLQMDLNDRTENFDALQAEMRKMSEALVRLEDEQEAKLRRIADLERELADANKDLEDLEAKLLEANDKANRLSVQQESSQGEIAFLREEQESDKMRIGDLEAALANVEQSLRDEKERARELEQRLASERRQREMVANKEKEEVQQVINELNKEASQAKDEARRLRKSLTSREVEAAEWKERLLELESNLREALGDLNGTRSSFLKSIAKLQGDLENTMRDLDKTKSSLADKDRIIKQRDALLETQALELRKMGEMLDKERQNHRNVKHQFETFQKTHQHVTRTVSSQDQRIIELEQAKAQDKKRIAQLESQFKEQLTERNNLLLTLWTRLSTLCGTDWAHDNSLINGRALPSLESVATMLPGFSKNLLAAVKTIETMVGNFQGRVKSVERDLWREYQTLENLLDQRTKKLDRLEAVVRNGIATGQINPNSQALLDAQARLARLEDAYRQLKVENHTLRAAAEARRAAHAQARDERQELNNNGMASPPLVPTGPKAKDRSVSGSGSGGSKIPKSSSKSTLNSSSRGAGVTTTPVKSSSSSALHYFHEPYSPHHHHQQQYGRHSGPSLGTGSHEDVARAARARGSPASRERERQREREEKRGGVDDGEGDDDTLTLPATTVPGGGGGGQQNPRLSSNAVGTSTSAATTQARSSASSPNPSGQPQSQPPRGRSQEREREREHQRPRESGASLLPKSASTGLVLGLSGGGASSGGGGSSSSSDNKWLLRLKDLENKLKAEREARMLDRGEAMKRISASESENRELREGLERERRRREGGRS
ncbi:hypothetical protein VTJ49DRAFT_2965 [Mycothermus thermophilus]|uniref:Anucleate primary sterigmata protein B n=1 Tax=Humicola insolens TaxID=85995 RepID=A0ABR3V8M8_HUMIN